MQSSDTELVEAFRRGDEQALTALLARHAPAVYRFGLRMCRDPEDARDVNVAPDEAAAHRELGAALETAIRLLDPKYREGLVLRDVEGLTAACASLKHTLGLCRAEPRGEVPATLGRRPRAAQASWTILRRRPSPPSPGSQPLVAPSAAALSGDPARGSCRRPRCRRR